MLIRVREGHLIQHGFGKDVTMDFPPGIYNTEDPKSFMDDTLARKFLAEAPFAVEEYVVPATSSQPVAREALPKSAEKSYGEQQLETIQKGEQEHNARMAQAKADRAVAKK